MLLGLTEGHREFIDRYYKALEDPAWTIPTPRGEETFEEYYGRTVVASGYLNAHRVTRNYGGPEEGGWWYDAGEPLASVPVASYGDVLAAAAYLGMKFAEESDVDRYSVAGADGDVVFSFEERFAESWPETRPHYE